MKAYDGFRPLHIGSVKLAPPVILAPMAGVTDLPFRRLVKRLGAPMVTSEMIASQAMIRAHDQTLRMSATVHDDFPMAVQIFGCDPKVMADAARMNADRGAAVIDINMGCPVKKVVKGDAGAALMRDEALAGAIMEAVARAVSVPVTVKMRTGWDHASRNAPNLARIAEQAGVAMVTVHGRTRSQFYSGHADWTFIGEVKRAVRIPVIGNGDITSIDDALSMLEQSGADGVMIGRGVYGRPWLLGQIAHFLTTGERRPDPSLPERFELMLEHFDAIIDHYGPVTGNRIARKHLGWYSKGLPGSAEFRSSLNGSEDAGRTRNVILDFYCPLIEGKAA